MSHLQKQISGAATGALSAEARAREALLRQDQRTPEAEKNIRALGKDPSAIPDYVENVDRAVLYGPECRSGRRQILLRYAVCYIFDVSISDQSKQDSIIARVGARSKVMLDYFISAWDEYLRPKTWMDSLSKDDQEKWALAKRSYNHKIEKSNDEMKRAKEEYQKKISKVMLEQATAREELKDVLRDFGISNAPLLMDQTDELETEALKKEFLELGMNFRPPDPKQI